MRVLRGRGIDPERDQEITAEMVDRTAAEGEPAVRVWRPPRQVAFGRRDANATGYEVARVVACEAGFRPVERSVGGRAVAYTGRTVAFAYAEPIDDEYRGLEDRYDRITGRVQRALWRLDVPAQRGEPDGAFCPGSYSLQYEGKIAGVAQRVRSDAALVAGIVVVSDHVAIADVLDRVYTALSLPFDRDAVGSIARAGGRADGATVRYTLEELLCEDDDPAVVRVDRET